MELKRIEYDLTVCKVKDISDIDMTANFCFIGKTDEELSLVCKAVEMYEEICDTFRQLSEEQLAAMPKEIFEQFMESDILMKDLQDKLRRSRIKF